MNILKRYSGKTIITVLTVAVLLSIFIKSIIVCRLCALLMVIACIMLGSRERKFINPFYLFAFTPFSLFMYMNLGGLYMLELTHDTWVLALINIYAFICAVYFTPNFRSFKHCIGMSSKSALIISSIIFYLLSMVGSFVPQVQALFWFSSIASVVCAMKTKMKPMYIFCVFVFLSKMLSGHASKMEALLLCITFLICYDKYFLTSAKQLKRIIIYSILGGIFMMFAFTFANKNRGNYDAESGVAYYTTYGHIEWNYNANLFMPYMYLCSAWTNLQYVTETQPQSTDGLWMIKPVLGYVGLDDNFERELELEPYSTFNTFTFVTVAFKDFGYWLSIIMSMFLGWYVKKIYSRYVVSKSPFDITSYILVALATVEMFFSNHFFMQSYPFTCLIMMEFWKYISRMLGSGLELDYNNIEEQ